MSAPTARVAAVAVFVGVLLAVLWVVYSVAVAPLLAVLS